MLLHLGFWRNRINKDDTKLNMTSLFCGTDVCISSTDICNPLIKRDTIDMLPFLRGTYCQNSKTKDLTYIAHC